MINILLNIQLYINIMATLSHALFKLPFTLTNEEVNDLCFGKHIITDLLNGYFTNDNICKILNFAFKYEFIHLNDLIFIVQVKILENKLKIIPAKLPMNIRTLIFDCDCVLKGVCECSCSFDKNQQFLLKHVTCFRYLFEVQKKFFDKSICPNLVDALCFNSDNCFHLITYVHNIGWYGTKLAIYNAVASSNLNILNYLYSLKYKCPKHTFDLAIKLNNPDIINYLQSHPDIFET